MSAPIMIPEAPPTSTTTRAKLISRARAISSAIKLDEADIAPVNARPQLERRATTKNNENKSACDRFPIVYLLYWNFLPRFGKLLNSHWNFELGDGDARFWSAHGTSTNPLYRKTTFPSARGLWRSDWDHTVVSEVYHFANCEPIRISRSVIPAVRSCSYPDGWLRDDQRERDSGEGCLPRTQRRRRRCALTDIAFEPVSSDRSLRCGERNFQGGDKEAETALEIQGRRRRDKSRYATPPIRGYSPAIGKSPFNENAWWRMQSASNQSPIKFPANREIYREFS